MSDELKPSVRQMLEIGKGCGLSELGEAHSQYLSHYTAFFLIDKFHEQLEEFNREIILLGLAVLDPLSTPQTFTLLDISIDEACAILVSKGC